MIASAAQIHQSAMTIHLPWPSADLSPNGRLHFHAVARAKKKAKNAAWGWTKAIMGALRIPAKSWRGPIAVQIVFYPGMNRARDIDNMQARMKAALDGIALALGVNDSQFRPVSSIGEIRNPACVEVTLWQVPE